MELGGLLQIFEHGGRGHHETGGQVPLIAGLWCLARCRGDGGVQIAKGCWVSRSLSWPSANNARSGQQVLPKLFLAQELHQIVERPLAWPNNDGLISV
jgi:hypothetical protein